MPWPQAPNWIRGQHGHNYLLLAALDSGAHATAFSCQRDDGYLFVAKYFRPGEQVVPNRARKKLRGMSPEQQAWIAEAAVMVALRQMSDEAHENLVSLVDYVKDRGFWLIVEYCDAPLDFLISRDLWHGPRLFPPLAQGVLFALEAMHNGGFVHLDLHLKNVFLSDLEARLDPKSVVFKLGDFGRSRHWNYNVGDRSDLIAIDLRDAATVLVQAWYGSGRVLKEKGLKGALGGLPKALREPLSRALRGELKADTSALDLWLALKGTKPLP
jgi:serine/threonine protein kinase